MRRSLPFLVLACLGVPGQGQTADPAATQQTKQILQYLSSLSKGSSGRLISGHQLNTQFSPAASFDSAITKIFRQTGQWVGLIGIDYQRLQKGPPTSMTQTNRPLIDYFRSGGLVAVMVSLTNPWTDNNQNDTTSRYKLPELVVQGTPGNVAWVRRLDSLAFGLRQLQDSGVTVFFRPLHEMNGAWFWWGSQSATLPAKQDYVNLWRYLFSYLTVTKGLHNLLWVFSPSARPSSGPGPAFKHDTLYYPGSDVVDVVGVDVYADSLDVPSYPALRSLGKPLALCEFGPGEYSAAAPNRFDFRILLTQIKTKYPEFVYWMSWNDFGNSIGSKYYGMTSQNFAQDVLTDPWVITRDKLRWRSATVVQQVDQLVPGTVELFQNYPNPFNPRTTITYRLAGSSEIAGGASDAGSATVRVQLKVLDILGRDIEVLIDEEKSSGTHVVSWDASRYPSGVYFCQLRTVGSVRMGRMLVLR